MRKCGTLLHISSLPGNYGIGNFGNDAYAFVDFLKNSGQSLWQILPLGITSFGDSPYQSQSSFAGNPYFIDPEQLYKDGLVTRDMLESQKNNADFVDYGKLYRERYPFLRKAFSSFDTHSEKYEKFLKENESWLDNFALFMAIKSLHKNRALTDFEYKYKSRDESALKDIEKRYSDEINFWKIGQYYFFKQWFALKKYANKSGVEIIGDIPIYVAADSADVWENPGLFLLDDEYNPTLVAGCPPDSMSKQGQKWGNPIYNWEKMKEDDYLWWKKRFEMNASLYDYLRIDHFRGFSAYYEINAADETAERGQWKRGVGFDFFKKVKDSIGNTKIIAEDLGFIDDDVKVLLEKCGYPGMKILEFGFDEKKESVHLPHNYKRNTFAYTGTHDNDTFMSYYLSSEGDTQTFIRSYLDSSLFNDICFKAVRALFSSVADNVIIPMQDYLSLPAMARMNTPSSIGNNWRWRVHGADFNESLEQKILSIARLYDRTER